MSVATDSSLDRLNILGAYSPDQRDLISLEGRRSCDGERVAQLLQKIWAANSGKRLLRTFQDSEQAGALCRISSTKVTSRRKRRQTLATRRPRFRPSISSLIDSNHCLANLCWA